MSDAEEQLGRIAYAVETLVEQNRRRERQEWYARLPEPLPEIKQVGLGSFLQAIPGLAALFEREVPAEFVTTTEGEHSVKCLCGATPELPLGRLVNCDCGRWFLFDGRAVHVALGPKREESA